MNEFLRQFRLKYPGAYDDMADADLARAIHRRHYADMDYATFLHKLEAKYGPSNTGPAEQPTHPTLSPGLGGAFDALQGAVLPTASQVEKLGAPQIGSGPGATEQLDLLRESSPGGVRAASAIAPIVAGGLAPRGSGLTTQSLLDNRLLGRGPAVGSKKAGGGIRSIGNAIKKHPLVSGIGGGIAGLQAWNALKRLFGQ